MQVDLHLIEHSPGLLIVGHPGAKFSLLGEQIFEEDNNRGFHLLEDKLIDNLFCDLVADTIYPIQSIDLHSLEFKDQLSDLL